MSIASKDFEKIRRKIDKQELEAKQITGMFRRLRQYLALRRWRQSLISW